MADMKDKNDGIYDPTRKREIIKTILIIFLVILLLLTFFSNTIMNRSLAEISTERTTSGKLTERIRERGLVESNQSWEVTADGNKVIDTIMVKSGQEIEKDKVLFTLAGSEGSEQLKAAEEQLSQLELDYQKALLTPAADYSSEDQAIKNAREDLNNAISKRDRFAANQDSAAAAESDYKDNKSELNFYNKQKEKFQSVITAIDTDEYIAAPAEYTGELISLKAELSDAENDYNSALTVYTALLTGSEEEGTNVTQEQIDSAKADLDAKEAVRDEARDAYSSKKSSMRSDMVSQLEEAESNAEWYAEAVSEYESSQAASAGLTLDDLDADVQAKQRTLESLITELNKTKTDKSNQDKISSLDLDAQKEKIEKQKEEVEKLKQDSDVTEIKSKYAGVVSSINVSPGDTTVPGMSLATIDISGEGYTVKITVDGAKTQKLKKGIDAEVVNNWGGGIEAVLTDIKNDTVAGSKNRILVFNVTGDVDSGTYIDLSIPCGSGSYDAIVPKSAVRHDNTGDFVLTVTSKSSPLGNRYYAERVAVEVVASDEVSSAVTGNISNGDYVITAASKPVSPGDQVRMKEK